MNSLSKQRLQDAYVCYHALIVIHHEMTDEEWAALTQKQLFDKAVKNIGKKINPSTLQTIIENLEKFQLPRNVQEQEHVNVEI